MQFKACELTDTYIFNQAPKRVLGTIQEVSKLQMKFKNKLQK